MSNFISRRQLIAAALTASATSGAVWAQTKPAASTGANGAKRPAAGRTLRIYAITFRGMTDVEKGFQDYFAARRIAVQITFRDLNRDNTRMPGFLEEIRRTKPDLVYTWGTSVTLGVVGTYDAYDPEIGRAHV